MLYPRLLSLKCDMAFKFIIGSKFNINPSQIGAMIGMGQLARPFSLKLAFF
jgi:hypothetical protein